MKILSFLAATAVTLPLIDSSAESREAAPPCIQLDVEGGLQLDFGDNYTDNVRMEVDNLNAQRARRR